MFERLTTWYKDLPEKKKYVELLTSLLTVPVLLTVILSNVNNLTAQKKESVQNQPVKEETLATNSAKKTIKPTPEEEVTPTPVISTDPLDSVCKKKVGPVEILNPQEGETINKDPLSIDISHDSTYCLTVWSYRINNSFWSEYNDKAIDLYNLSSGDKTLEVKVKSIASSDEVILKRSFVYKNVNDSLTPSPISTASAEIQ